MKLDYLPPTGNYVLTVAQADHDVGELMLHHGLDFSRPRSGTVWATLFSKNPYSVVDWFDVASPAAARQLAPLAARVASSWAIDSPRHIALPADKELWPFQRGAVDYALNGFADPWDDVPSTILGDEPGLGKTEEAIAIANEIQASRILVVCPGAVREQWAERILEWSTMPALWALVGRHGSRLPALNKICRVTSSRHGINPSAPWTIISYDLVRRPAIFEALMAAPEYDLLILDEAHYVKSVDAKRTRALFGSGGLASRCHAVLALTGTLLPNRPGEAYVLASGMCPGSVDGATSEEFSERYNPREKVAYADPDTGKTRFKSIESVGRTRELQARLRGNFMTRHVKRGKFGVMTQLQMPVYDLVRLLETGPVKAALDAERLLDIDPERDIGQQLADAGLRGSVSTVRKAMGLALAPQFIGYLDLLLEGGEEKLVVFAWHKEVMDILCAGLEKWGVLRVDGRTSPADKRRMVDEFQADPWKRIILGNTLTLGTGTDGLQNVADHAVICEPSWVPGENVQCFDRLDRGGQKRVVHGEILVAPNSLSEGILGSALQKMRPISQSLDRKE